MSYVIAYVPARRGIKRSLSVEVPERVEQLLREGARRLRARASVERPVGEAPLVARLRSTVGKYLLRDRPDASELEVGQFLDALRADEIMLVLACEGGDADAWEDLMRGYRPTVLSAARAGVPTEAEAEELAGSVWAELYGLRTREGDGAPAGKLAYYSGCGSLGGWLRAVVGQLAVDRHRRSAKLVQTEEPADFDRLGDTERAGDGWIGQRALDPERELSENESARAVREALARAVAALGDEDRLLVRLYYFDGLRLKEAGAVLGVHEATASRRLTRVHGEIRRGVETILTSERGWTAEETAATLTEVAARLDADLASLVAPERVAGEGV